MKTVIIRKVLLCTALVLLLVSADLFLVERMVVKKLALTEVPVCAQTRKQGEVIREDDLILINIPEAYVMNHVVTDPGQIVGAVVKRGYTIPAGSLFYEETVNNKKDHPNE
ncbi:MAG: SAF domain-containing protein [Bulleidia sp.]